MSRPSAERVAEIRAWAKEFCCAGRGGVGDLIAEIDALTEYGREAIAASTASDEAKAALQVELAKVTAERDEARRIAGEALDGWEQWAAGVGGEDEQRVVRLRAALGKVGA